MAKENRSRYTLLGLMHYGEFTGYEMRKRLEQAVGMFWQEESASIYPALRGLVADGLAETIPDPEDRGPRRIRHRLTPQGRAAFAAWMERDPAPAAMRNEFALKLFFGGLADPARLLAWIEREAATVRELEAGIAQAAAALPTGKDALAWHLVADYGRRLAGATAAWCRDATLALESAAMDAPATPFNAPAPDQEVV